MTKALLMFGACCALAAHAVQMATQPWVTNRIEQAEARVGAQVVGATNGIPAQIAAATNGIPGQIAAATSAATNAIAGAFLPRTYNDGEYSAYARYEATPSGVGLASSQLMSPLAFFDRVYVITDDEQGPLGGIGQYGGLFLNARQEVENMIRAKSLGGIWDAELGVWWTPVMSNGALTYQATTNVNMNAEN